MKRLLFFSLFFFPFIAVAYTNPGVPTGFVNDFAGMLTDNERVALEQTLLQYAATSGNEVAIVTIPTLEGDTIENFAVELFAEWQIGKKGEDNGVLLLVARDEREVRIEVGYGLEGALTDAQSIGIINKIIVPAFRNDAYGEGLQKGAEAIIAVTKGEATYEVPPSEENGGWSFEKIIFFVIFGFMWLASILSRSKSWYAGGILGGIAGVVIGLFKGFLFAGLIGIGVLVPLGLLFDFLVSRAYEKSRTHGMRPPWWIGGGGFGRGSGGGFGGFGGGSSGGGGASGRW